MENQIKNILKAKNMKQTQLAERLGISLQQLNNTISGRNTASMAVYERIAKELDVEFWQLFAPEGVIGTITKPIQQTCPYCGHEIVIELK